MRQVPKNANTFPYVIIGNGKLAKHIIHYFQLLEINYSHWYRKPNSSLSSFNLENKKIIILINDDAIENFILKNNLEKINNSILIHCSGILNTKFALGMHPLMTFSDDLYDFDTYKKIPFIVDSSKIEFQKVFPEFMNQFYYIPKDKKVLYHLWASMAGNFTSMLWMNYFEFAKENFNLKKEHIIPYMTQITENLINLDDPLTGPIKRGDLNTIEKHLAEIKDTHFEDLYKSFVKVYEHMRKINE